LFRLRKNPDAVKKMSTNVALPILSIDPHATTKHTLCGYAWSDVTNALIRAIGTADTTRAQRWAAELVCSELGLGRLEAALFHAWALHVGPAFPGWPRTWYNAISQIRSFWSKAGGDIKSVRNTPIVRQLVAESVASLILSAKKPLPGLPTSADCFREAEAMRVRIRAGGGVGDQYATRRVWTAGTDGADLKTIGNELEAALRSGQVQRLLFWIVWIITLDTQADAPSAKERGPGHLSVKQRKSLLWFLIAVLKELANEGAFLSVEDRNGLFGSLELTWNKLGTKGRRDCIVAIALSVQDHLQRKNSLTLGGPTGPQSQSAIRGASSGTDDLYSSIAAEARKYLLEKPEIVGLVEPVVDTAKKPKLEPLDKLNLAYKLINPH
jgi:hypothetical protein